MCLAFCFTTLANRKRELDLDRLTLDYNLGYSIFTSGAVTGVLAKWMIFDHDACFTTITPGLDCWCCWTVVELLKSIYACISALRMFSGVRVVNANGTSCVCGSSPNMWSPSKCLIASTMVSRFCRDVVDLFNKYKPLGSSWWGELFGDGSLSTSTFGSALIAASSTDGNLKQIDKMNSNKPILRDFGNRQIMNYDCNMSWPI